MKTLLAQAAVDITRIDLPPSGLPATLPEIAARIFGWLVGFAGAFAVAAVIYSGIMYITSAGDATQAEKAKKNLTWAIIAVILISVSASIVWLVNDVLKNVAPR